VQYNFLQKEKILNEGNKVGKIVFMHAMKAYEEVEVQFYSFLTSEINSMLALSCPKCFTPMDTTLVQLNMDLGRSQSQSGCSGKYIVYVTPHKKFMNSY